MSQGIRAFNWDSVRGIHNHSANPAAGAQVADKTVPLGRRWLVTGIQVPVVNAAAAATRSFQLRILPDGTTVFIYAASGALIISQTASVTFSPNAVATSITGVSDTIVPGGFGILDLPAGAIIRLYYLNIQGADDIGIATYTYKEI